MKILDYRLYFLARYKIAECRREGFSQTMCRDWFTQTGRDVSLAFIAKHWEYDS